MQLDYCCLYLWPEMIYMITNAITNVTWVGVSKKVWSNKLHKHVVMNFCSSTYPTITIIKCKITIMQINTDWNTEWWDSAGISSSVELVGFGLLRQPVHACMMCHHYNKESGGQQSWICCFCWESIDWPNTLLANMPLIASESSCEDEAISKEVGRWQMVLTDDQQNIVLQHFANIPVWFKSESFSWSCQKKKNPTSCQSGFKGDKLEQQTKGCQILCDTLLYLYHTFMCRLIWYFPQGWLFVMVDNILK